MGLNAETSYLAETLLLLSVIFGVLLFFFPGTGILSLLWLLGIYGIVFGIVFIVRAFRLRAWAASVTP